MFTNSDFTPEKLAASGGDEFPLPPNQHMEVLEETDDLQRGGEGMMKRVSKEFDSTKGLSSQEAIVVQTITHAEECTRSISNFSPLPRQFSLGMNSSRRADLMLSECVV